MGNLNSLRSKFGLYMLTTYIKLHSRAGITPLSARESVTSSSDAEASLACIVSPAYGLGIMLARGTF